MTYAQSFNLSTPTGLEEANTLDEIIRNVKIALNERFVDILGVDLSSATDPQRVTKIVIPSAGMTIRNSTDAATMLGVSNSAVTLGATTLSGTMTGGTLSPTTLNVPNGTSITNASLTTPALVDAAIVGGSASNLTALTVTGTPVITGNLTVTGTLTAGSLSGPTTVPAANVTAGAFQNAAYTFPNNLNVSGTLAPTTLTIPSGTTIPTHTETGTITATGSTRNGGTISGATISGSTLSGATTNSGTISGGTVSGATLNNTTFTGTVSGISTNPTTAIYELGADTAFTGTVQTILSVNPGSGTWVAMVSVNMAMTIPAATTGTIYANAFCSGMSGNARMGRILNTALSTQETLTGTLSLVGTTSSGTLNVSVFGNQGGTILAQGTRVLMIKIA